MQGCYDWFLAVCDGGEAGLELEDVSPHEGCYACWVGGNRCLFRRSGGRGGFLKSGRVEDRVLRGGLDV